MAPVVKKKKKIEEIPLLYPRDLKLIRVKYRRYLLNYDHLARITKLNIAKDNLLLIIHSNLVNAVLDFARDFARVVLPVPPFPAMAIV